MSESTMNYADVECPWCGFEQSDSWEFCREQPEDRECEDCGKAFCCWAEVERSYHARTIS